MGYVDRNLIPGESIVDWADIHWVAFLKAILLGIAAFAFMAFSPTDRLGLPPDAAGYVRMAAFGVLLLAALWHFASAVILRLTTEVALTNKRIIAKTGLVQRDTIELNLDKVESLLVDQTVLGRLLGYGIVRIRGTGGSEFRALNISNPLRFKTAAYTALDRYKPAR